MKRVLTILAILLFVAVAALAIFLATFDADRFRPQLVAELEKAIGQPVTLERISLGWRGGLALQLKQLTVADRTAPTSEPLLRVDQARAVVRLWPLLRREVQVTAVVLTRPEVRVSRGLDGRINLVGLAVAGSPAAVVRPTAQPAAPAGPAGAPAAPAVAIGSVRIAEGQVHWTDALKTPVAELRLRDIDVTLRDLAPTQPFDFEARLALFSEHQNVQLSGRVQLPALPGQDAASMESLRLEIDFGRINWAEVRGAFPAIQQADVKRVEGLLQVVVERLVLSPDGWAKAVARLQMKNGRKELAQWPQPIEGITLEATLAQGRAEIKQALARIAGGTLQVSGTLEGLGQPVVRSHLKVALTDVPLELLQPHPNPQDPYLRGLCSATLEGTAEGSLEQLLASLAGQGQVSVQEPVLVNLNILREVFQKLAMIPGLVQRFEQRLPPEYRQQLTAKDTVLSPIDATFHMRNNHIQLSEETLTTDIYLMQLATVVGWDGSIGGPAALSIDPVFSQALAGAVKELSYLQDAQGRIYIPLVVQGTVSRPQILPDVGYVASRLVVTKVQDLLGEFLQKQLGPETPAEAAPTEPAAP